MNDDRQYQFVQFEMLFNYCLWQIWHCRWKLLQWVSFLQNFLKHVSPFWIWSRDGSSSLCTYCKLYHTQHTGHSTIERDPSSQLCVEGIQNFFQTLPFKNRLKKSKSTFTHWWKKYSSIFMPTYKQKYYWIKCEA